MNATETKIGSGSGWHAMQMRVHGSILDPTLIYLPGLHGDWTLVGSFRRALADSVRFVEFTYSRSTSSSLEDYGKAILERLNDQHIREGWLLLESFGSVVGWEVLRQARSADLTINGIILAGGFVRHPHPLLVSLARVINSSMPMGALRLFCRAYACYANVRHRRAPETLGSVAEFVRRRCEEEDRQAICHRYKLIAGSDPRAFVAGAGVPVYQLCGVLDPIVPWLPVRWWLTRHCQTYKASRILWGDHNVLGTNPDEAARQVLQWIGAATPPENKLNSPAVGQRRTGD